VSLGTPYRFPYSVGYWLTPRTWKRIVRFWWQRRTRGFDDSVCWDLQHELAKWLAPRLDALADMSSGSPAGYQLSPVDDGYDFDKSDHERWRLDIREAASALAQYVRSDAGTAWWDSDAISIEDRIELDRRAERDADEAMVWVAKWWRHLWD